MAPQAPRAPNLNLKSQSQISDPISRAPNLNLKSQSQISDLRPQSPCRSNPPSPSRSFEALISIHTANLQISALKSLGWKAVQIFSLKSWISSELDRRFLLVWEISFSKSLVSNLKVSHRRPSD